MKKEYPDWTGKVYDTTLMWTVTDYCNFSCSGCIATAKKAGKDYIPERIDISALKKTLDDSNQIFKILFTGGEPLLIENIIDVFAEVTTKNYMALITNLTNPKVKELGERIDPSRVLFLKASAHLMELEKRNLLDTFLDHYNLLQEKGFTLFTEEIAYPIMADKVDAYKKIFLDRGIELCFQAFRGIWQGKKYPEAYTEEEHRIFNFSSIGIASKEMHYRKNKKCNAGYNACIARPNGDIHRCYDIPDSLGNLYTGIKLYDTLIECPLDFCDCPLAVFESHLFERAMDETESKVLVQ